jgi:hypothetical protein
MVSAEEWDEGGGGRPAGGVGEVGEAMASSSGFAIRRPPSDWDRLRSPFMLPHARLAIEMATAAGCVCVVVLSERQATASH